MVSKEKLKLGAVFSLVLLTLIVLFGKHFLSGAESLNTHTEEDGGIKDNTDINAPKSIASRELIAFHTHFFCIDPSDPAHSGGYWFEITKDDSKTLQLRVSGVMNGKTSVEQSLLGEVQNIIEQYDLVQFNGIDRITDGLPAEHGPCSLSADYLSEEHLGFTMDGDPDSPWCIALKKLFFQVFASAGFSEFQSAAEDSAITNCTIIIGIEDLYYDYGIILDPAGETKFYRSVYDMSRDELREEKLIELDAALLEGLRKHIRESGIPACDDIDASNYDPTIVHQPGDFLDIAIDHENGRQLYLQVTGDSFTTEWFLMRDQLKEYLDSLF